MLSDDYVERIASKKPSLSATLQDQFCFIVRHQARKPFGLGCSPFSGLLSLPLLKKVTA